MAEKGRPLLLRAADLLFLGATTVGLFLVVSLLRGGTMFPRFRVIRGAVAVLTIMITGCLGSEKKITAPTNYLADQPDTTNASYYWTHLDEIWIPDIGSLSQLVITAQRNNPGLDGAELRAHIWRVLKGLKDAGWLPWPQGVPDPDRVYTYPLSAKEFWLLFWKPGRYTVVTYITASQAATEADKQWPGGRWQTRGDAFFQAYWNILLCQHLGADWAEAYTTTHEWLTRDPLEQQMALSNNAVGRSMFGETGQQPDADYAARLKNARYEFVTDLPAFLPYLVYIRIS